MTQELKASDVLDGTADYIEKYGLNKGWYFKGFSPDTDALFVEERVVVLYGAGMTPPCCTLGALMMTSVKMGFGVHNVFSNAGIRRAFTEGAGVDWHSIPEWNDRPSQRKARVVAAIRKAATYARIKEVEAKIETLEKVVSE